MRRQLEKFYAFLDVPIDMWSRLVLPILCVPLVLSFKLPLWRISMEAPQYPSGLWLDVYTFKLESGNDNHDITEINTLNHYIGMHQIVPEDFNELGYMPFVLGVLVILTLRVAAIGNVRMLIDLAVTTGYAMSFLFARFVYRLYTFGHELKPDAPFDVEPFTPVIIGTKQIANFTTHSMPRAGTYYVTVFVLGVMLVTLIHLVLGRVRAMRRGSLRPPPSTWGEQTNVQTNQ